MKGIHPITRFQVGITSSNWAKHTVNCIGIKWQHGIYLASKDFSPQLKLVQRNPWWQSHHLTSLTVPITSFLKLESADACLFLNVLHAFISILEFKKLMMCLTRPGRTGLCNAILLSSIYFQSLLVTTDVVSELWSGESWNFIIQSWHGLRLL